MSEENYKRFCIYFDKLEKLGIGYSLGDLFRKARELDLEPCKESTDFIRKKNKCHS